MRTALKVVISGLAVLAIAARAIWPSLNIDAVSLGLLAVAVLPWFAHLVDTFELPGVKIRLRQLESAGEKVGGGRASGTPTPELPIFLSIAKGDPNLALVSLRIEIERRLRALASARGIDSNASIALLAQRLADAEVLSSPVTEGLLEIVRAGNSAAHGAKVEPAAADWALERGPEIIGALDDSLLNALPDDLESWLSRALAVIEFEGGELPEVCRKYLERAEREGRITMPISAGGPNERARVVLSGLDALEEVGDDISPRWGIHYRITGKGRVLLARLEKEATPNPQLETNG